MYIDKIKNDFENALTSLLDNSEYELDDAIVLGGSTSEVIGGFMGSNTKPEIAKPIIEIFIEKVKERGLFPLIQCCEHLNRALVVEKEYADYYGLQEVNVIPVNNAGGGFATAAYELFDEPVVIEYAVKVTAGLDIGDTFIGMHLNPEKIGVALNSDIKNIGDANLSMIRTRDKLIGGERAKHYKAFEKKDFK